MPLRTVPRLNGVAIEYKVPTTPNIKFFYQSLFSPGKAMSNRIRFVSYSASSAPGLGTRFVASLLNRNALGEVARLVHVQTASLGDVVC